MWLKCLCFPGLITLSKLNASRAKVRRFHFSVFDCCIMSYSSNLPVASQQTPWPLPPQRSGSATLDETTNDDTMTQSQATLSFSKTLPPPVAAIESETRASPTSAVSEEKPQWQAVMVAEQVRTGRSSSPKSKKRSSSTSLSPPARPRAEEDTSVTTGTATSVGTTRVPSGIRIGSQPRPRSVKPTMESRVTAIETQLVYMESRMDATDTAVSENQIEMDNVRQELYQQNEAFMVQTRDLLNRYGEQQLLLQRLSETCARIELQLEKSQLIINSPTQFSVATPVRAQDQSVDLLDLPMLASSSISIPPASTNPTTRQWEADNRPIQQIPQPAFLNTSSAQAAQWSPSPTAASQPQQQVRMPDARYMAPEMLHGGVLQPQPTNHMNHFSAHETNYATFTNLQGHSTGQGDVQQQMRNVMCHSNFRVCQRPNHQLFNFGWESCELQVVAQ